MPRLVPNSMPAERIGAGCSFAETVESAARVIVNGGELFGTPTIDFGAILNGTTDYIKYKLQGHELNSAEISIVHEFWPDFEADDAANHYLLDTENVGRTIISKDGSNRLVCFLGGTVVLVANLVDFSSYWLVGLRNIIVAVGSSGSNLLYLNGNLVTTNAAVWSPTRPSELYLGATFASTSLFKGKIGQVKIFNSLLAAQDAQNFYDNSTYNYPNDALVYLPMRACDHDPTNTRTLDVSGNGYHGTLVGSPVKQQKRGYLFDGVDDAFTGLPALTGDYTVNILADNEVNSYNTDTVYESLKTPGGFSGVVHNLMVVPSILTPLQEADNRIQMIKQVNHA